MKPDIKFLNDKRIKYETDEDGFIHIQGTLTVCNDLTLETVKTISGNVDLREGSTFTAPALNQCRNVDLREGATFTAPALNQCGNVWLLEGSTFTAPALNQCGNVWLLEGATFTAPALNQCGDVDLLREGATFTAPALNQCGNVWLLEGATFTAPALNQCGNVWLLEGSTFTAPALNQCGDVELREGATFTAPALNQCGGYVDLREGATFTAPALNQCRNVWLLEGSTFTAPALNQCGNVDLREGSTFTAPALKTLSGINGNTEILGHKVTVFDGIGTVIRREKQTENVLIRWANYARFAEGKLTGNAVIVASQGEHNAHGQTIEEALEALRWKTADRDVDEYRGLDKGTIKTVQEWALVYHIVTGACLEGTRQFIQSRGELNETYTLEEVLAATAGQYGAERFKEVVS